MNVRLDSFELVNAKKCATSGAVLMMPSRRNIHFDKQTVNLANTKLVKIACAPEMQCSHYCHNNKEDESDHLVDGEYRHIKWHVQIEQW